MEVMGRSGAAKGTAFLVHESRRERDTVLYFVTAGHLMDPFPLGESRTTSLRIRFLVNETSGIETNGGDITFPGGIHQGLDLAVVKVATTLVGPIPMPIASRSPRPGEEFLLKGRGERGLIVLTERARFRSTRLVIGDKTAADVDGLMGAPAVIDGAVFGLVSECSSTRVPVITLLEGAYGFLERTIPGWAPPRGSR
jgi:hypothetical protein